jgi:hypothetical protein
MSTADRNIDAWQESLVHCSTEGHEKQKAGRHDVRKILSQIAGGPVTLMLSML